MMFSGHYFFNVLDKKTSKTIRKIEYTNYVPKKARVPQFYNRCPWYSFISNDWLSNWSYHNTFYPGCYLKFVLSSSIAFPNPLDLSEDFFVKNISGRTFTLNSDYKSVYAKVSSKQLTTDGLLTIFSVAQADALVGPFSVRAVMASPDSLVQPQFVYSGENRHYLSEHTYSALNFPELAIEGDQKLTADFSFLLRW